jgi:hypothetical protein
MNPSARWPWIDEIKPTPKNGGPGEARNITETIVNRGCGACRSGDSSQHHPQISRTRPNSRPGFHDEVKEQHERVTKPRLNISKIQPVFKDSIRDGNHLDFVTDVGT